MKARRLCDYEISEITLELSLLIKGGVDLASAFALLGQEEQGCLKKILCEISENLDSGMSLKEALQKCQGFPKDVIELINVGQQTGRCEESLLSISQYYKQRIELKETLKSALYYPAFLFTLMLAVIIILLTEVLPIFDSIYSSLGSGLTSVSKILLDFGKIIKLLLPYFLRMVLIFAVFACICVKTSYKYKIIKHTKNKYSDKGILEKLYRARFAQGLSMAINSGLPISDSFVLASSFIAKEDRCYEKYMACLKDLNEGESLGKALEINEIFSLSQCRLLTIGTKAGQEYMVIEELSRRISEETIKSITKIVNRIEPTMVVVSSLLVGIILVSVMLPLINLMSSIG